MSGPWEKYAPKAAEDGPWTKYESTLPKEALDRAAAADRIAEDRMILANSGTAGGIAAKAAQGIPFAGEYVDEAFDALDPGRGQRVRDIQGAMDREMPKTAMASQIAGGVVGAVPMAVAAAPAVTAAAPASIGGQVLAATGAAGVAGAVEGGVAGYGRGTNRKERRDMATNDAVVGGVVGAGAGLAAPLISAGAKNLVNWFKSSEIGAIASEMGISKSAAKIIRQALDGEDVANAGSRIARLGDDAMLADAGPQAAQLLDTAMSEGGQALTIGRNAVQGRAATTTPALRRTFDAVLGEPAGIRNASKRIAKGSAAARKTAYDAAYSTPTPTVGPKAKAIDDVLGRIPSKTLNSAVQEANEAMQEAGTRNMNIIAKIADDGSVSFEQPLNIQQLDELKKALGKVATDNKDPVTGALNAAGLRAQRLARDLKTAIADAVPVYGRAVKLGGDKIAEDNALLLGRSALNNNSTLEDVTDAMANASKAEKTAFKQGLREAIEDTMSRVKGVVSDPNADAREAQKIWSEMSSRKTRDKIEAAIGKPSADRLWSMMERELPMLETRGAVARGSQTAIRQSGQNAISETLSPSIVGKALRGEALDATKRAAQVASNTTPGADAAKRAEILAEVAEVLTGRRGRDAAQALSIVNRAIKGQPISEAQAKAVGRAIGSGASLSGYQAGTQSLEQR